MMNKKRNNYLIGLADNALHNVPATENGGGMLVKDRDIQKTYIKKAYDGQTSGLGVAVAMSGLLPALAIYYADKPDKRKVNRRAILEVIANMINNDNDFSLSSRINNAKALLKEAINSDENQRKDLKREVEDCSIALKQVVRTYNLVEK